MHLATDALYKTYRYILNNNCADYSCCQLPQ